MSEDSPAPSKSTWPREMAMLEAIRALEASEARMVTGDQLAEMTGLSPADVRQSFSALTESGYITFGTKTGGTQVWLVVAPRLRERGRRAVHQWPEDGYAALVAIIEARIQVADDPDERSRLTALLEGVAGVGRDVITSVLSALARETIGLK